MTLYVATHMTLESLYAATIVLSNIKLQIPFQNTKMPFSTQLASIVN